MKRLLVTGASGFLGWNICRYARENWHVVGTVYTNSIRCDGVDIERVDLTSYSDMKNLIDRCRADVVIHTAAETDPNRCQENRSESQKVNVDVAVNLAGLCADIGASYVFTSTDLVFDGNNPSYSEGDAVSPVSFYGEQKVTAEERILDRYAHSLVCRMPLMFGDPGPVAKSFIQPMIKTLHAGGKLKLFTDEYRTPVSGDDAAKGILKFCDAQCGILHLGGCESISRYEFGDCLADVMNYSSKLLVALKQKDLVLSAPRPSNVSLDSSKAFSLGFAPGTIRSELERLSSQLTNYLHNG